MAYADRSHRATTNPYSPRAFAVCDGCGGWFNRVNLFDQYEWFGDVLTDTRFRVCRECLDKPQPQFRPVILPPDPVPIDDPRPEVPTILQNLNGFTQYTGPQGTSITNPVLTVLDPTQPFESTAQVIASANTGWGLPMPSLTLHTGTISVGGVGQQAVAANANRAYLLAFNPYGGLLAVAQSASPVLGVNSSNILSPTLPEQTTVIVGTGEALLQNGGTTPPAAVWTGSIWVLGLVAGEPWWIWEG